ncbi:hypothetical protein MGG_17009, partial [Pyricularia oryzae 70-15]
RSEIKIVYLDIKLSVKNIVEKNRLGVDELLFDNIFKLNLVPKLRSLGYVDIIDWFSILDTDPQNWVFANLTPGNNKWCFFKSFFFLVNLFANPISGNINGIIPGNFKNN